MNDKLFHDQGYIYFSPIEPTFKDDVTIRLQSAEELISASVIVREKGDEADIEFSLTFERIDNTGNFNLWKGVIPAREKAYHYSFKVVYSDGFVRYYGVYGESDEYKPECGFYVIPGFSTPDWSKGIFWYSIVPDAFYNGNVLNDKTGEFQDVTKKTGYTHPFCSRYGGDLRGIIKKLDYIQDLDVDAVFINPIWSCKDSAGYGPDNFDLLDTAYGSDEELCELIEKLHQRKIKFMMDAVVVFSTQQSNLYNLVDEWPKAGASKDEKSEYCNFFHFKHWPDSYQNYFASLVFDYSKDAARDYIYRKPDSFLQRYLRKPYCIDAWRFDSASLLWGQNMTPIDVAADIKKYLKPINEDMLYLSESYEGMDEGVWETCWNMHQLFNLREWMMGKYDIKFFLKKTQMYSNARCRPLALSLYTHFDNHDVPRLYPLVSEKSRLISGIICYMTYLGSPTLFYGDETGDHQINCGYYHGFDWNTDNWDSDFYHLYKTLSNIRHLYPVFKMGIVRVGFLDNDAEILSYGRFDENGAAIVVLNPHNEQKLLTLKVDIYELILTDVISGMNYTVANGEINVLVDAGGAVMIKNCSDNIICYRKRKEDNLLPQGNNPDPFAPECDWSYSFKIESKIFKSSYCIYAGENNQNAVYLFVKRDSEKIHLQFGRIVGGIKVPFFEKKVIPDDLTVQFQKIGTRFSAAYKHQEKWQELGSNLPAAFDEMHIGVIGSVPIGIYSSGIGNIATGGKSVFTPFSIHGFNGDWTQYHKTTKVLRQCVKSGKFDYINGGLIQCSDQRRGLLIYERSLNNFRITASLKPESEKGYCGIFFGADNNGDGGYYYNTDGQMWSLTTNGECLRKGKSYGIETTIERIGKKTVIYSGKDSIPVLCEPLDKSEGFVGFYSIKTPFRLLNYYVTDLAPSIFNQNIFWNIEGDKVQYKGSGALGIKGNAYTSFKASVKISLNKLNENNEAFAGILLSTEGDLPQNDGLFFNISSDGFVYLKHGAIVLKKSQIQGKEHDLEVCGHDGHYEMLIDRQKIADYQDDVMIGCTPSIACVNADVCFKNFEILML